MPCGGFWDFVRLCEYDIPCLGLFIYGHLVPVIQLAAAGKKIFFYLLSIQKIFAELTYMFSSLLFLFLWSTLISVYI
jgi:hypothetical protein